MINFDDVTKENIKEDNRNWLQIPHHPYRMWGSIGGSRSGKIISLFNLIKEEPDIDKIYLYAKDPYEAKYWFLINKRENTGLKHFNDFKAFVEHSNYMDDIYRNIEGYNPNKKRKLLIVFDGMIADMLSNKKLNPKVTELFIRSIKLNICLIFITQFYFAVPKNIRLNSMQHFIMKIPNKRELQQIAFNHLLQNHILF